ncbi:mitochondrial 37S ribosomal protein rsm10 [Cadophora gregata]|uniref:mitochondrial 37S ribosomal protein rsm10 n=1 Tax=Cadophora gregata TaxID=51156 RepID=UPI0026DD3D7A|nr:mitochondrial 37S ribosomal protein rsm10 [Cadophora gregata]KAK0099676.1 mitochondrial 37S ribosomal protein rsm10 [Cadophora gregata f. sp. sojae]KAK0116411.1 mitochondrial 37S ribosomal protein rsm10 [Cadophora gregata]
MATSAPLRIPWRAIANSASKQSTGVLRTPCIATLLPSSRRHASSDIFTNTSSSQAERQKFVDGSIGAEASKLEPPPEEDLTEPEIRLPRAVQAAYLRPLRRTPTYGVPTCDLQLRSYSVRNLEFFADFALRAAYYLGLPAHGPVPLPRIVERWTVPRGSFIHKKSQENFERRTLRRLIQIRDGEAEAQELWLAFLRKHAYYGVGMKANVWEFSSIDVGKDMDAQMEKMRGELESTLGDFAFRKNGETGKKAIEVINRENFRAATGGNAPMLKRIP